MTATETETEPTSSGPAKAGNLSVGELGAMISKGRKAASAQKETETSETQSEQADAEGLETKTELEQASADETQTEEAAETEQQPEAEVDEDKAGAEAEAKQAKPKAVSDLQKRVHKVVDQRDAERNARLAAERELAALRAEVQSPKPKGQSPEATQTAGSQMNEQFAGDAEVVSLDKTLADIEAFLDFAARNPDGGSFEEGGKTYELDADQMRAFRSKSEKERIRLSSKREARLETARTAFMAKRAEAHTEAVRLYPWVEQKASAEFQEAIRLIRENPGVMNHADFELIVARQVAGQRLETEARKKLTGGNGNGKFERAALKGQKPTPVVTHSPAAAPKVSGAAAKAKASEETFKTSGKVNDLANMLAERKRARLAAA